MEIKQFIEKVFKGGWKGKGFCYEGEPDTPASWLNCRDNILQEYNVDAFFEMILDTEAWQAVEKVEGWATDKEQKEYQPHRMGSHSDTWGCQGDEDNCYCNSPKTFRFYMHQMIDALCEGKTIEDYIKTL